MLSKKSEQFLVELRMYLMSKGKNDKQINEITDELEDHLLQAEVNGKNIDHIVGESPKEYMKSIGKTMKTDFQQMVILAPLTLLLLGAYLSLVPAIEGTFTLSKNIILVGSILVAISIAVYSFLLIKGVPKLLHSKWIYVLAIFTITFVTGIWILFLIFWQKDKPFFVATPMQNTIILIACIIIFIASAIYTKTWFTIWIPILISLGPLANKFIPQKINEDPTLILITIFILFIVIFIVLFIYLRKRKK